MYVGRKIKQLRQALNYTQNEFAKELGVSQPYYSAIENGKKQISNKMLIGITERWLLDKGYFESKNIEKEREYLGAIKGGKIGGDYESMIEGIDYTVDKEGSWVAEKGSKLELLITRAANVAMISNIIDEKAIPTMIRLLKLEVLLIKNNLLPKKPIIAEFDLIIEALSELQSKYLNNENDKVINLEHITHIDSTIKSLNTMFYKQFDSLYEKTNPASEILKVKTFDDFLNYLANGSYKNEY